MTKTTVQINKADAWVDTMPVQPTPGGTLHVSLEVLFKGQDEHRYASLKKRIPQGINHAILILDIVFGNIEIYMPSSRHLQYAEGLQQSSEFTSIEIYFDGKPEKTITNIPIIK